MLNYIWIALAAIGIISAVTIDVSNSINDKYANGGEINAVFFLKDTTDNKAKSELIISKETMRAIYGIGDTNNFKSNAELTFTKSNSGSFILNVNSDSPEIILQIASADGKSDDIYGTFTSARKKESNIIEAKIVFEKVSFLKMKGITNAILDYAKTAVNIALGLIGIMALWLGIMKIAQESGLITKFANAAKPITRFLFPDVPTDHPAIGSILMNISANMLGLGNAATPFGLKAMEELDKLNPEKGTATNAMCTFLAINTAGLTLIPATAIAVRAAAGSSNPSIIIGTSFFGALCATSAAILSVKILEKFSIPGFKFGQWIKNSYKLFLGLFVFSLIAVLLFTTDIIKLPSLNVDIIKEIIQFISILAIPLIIILFLTYGMYKKVKVYETFVEGAKEGFDVAVRIIPYLVAMLMAIGIFRAGGAMDFLIVLLNPITSLIGFPAEALPMALMRPLSGSGSLGIMTEIIAKHGADSFIGVLVSTIMGSTETTFYVIALYFGSVNIKRARHALAAGLIADFIGIVAALLITRILFG
ncbi:MAG: spore maturation protein [Melioribacteraceae bacterium]|nr:spore maturation protein [Melioribacteraceae bacterium]